MAIVDPTTPDELWYPIPSLPGYQMSSEFRVRSFRIKGGPLRGTISPEKWRIISLGKNKRGYLWFTSCINRKCRHVNVSHIVAELAYGFTPDKVHVVRHLDDNKENNYAYNIAVGTPMDNTRDMIRNGLMFRGEQRYHAKLTEADVRSIRERVKSGTSNTQIAKEYGMDQSTICKIVKRHKWKHVI